MKISNYYHTLKYLKASQIYHRIIKRFVHPKVHIVVGVCEPVFGEYRPVELYEQKLFADGAVRFLNADGVCNSEADWNDESNVKLWLYNLHYFDDLNAIGASSRAELQIEFIERWIAQNPPGFGNGWEPYTLSLRIVNWVKVFLGHIEPTQEMLDSLACQADFLSQDLEHHILGNHLFVNAKSLIFAGLYLTGDDAEKWLSIGLDIYCAELNEQVLKDGGNFELTPMYHAIMLVDLLDLLNVFNVYSNKVNIDVVNKTKAVAIKMLSWLEAMSHCDGKISFFNDSTFAIAPTNELISEYAGKLGLVVDSVKDNDEPNDSGISLKDLSGYVSVKTADYSLIADLAAVGPDYIPGHAHADNLSFEFALAGQRVFVNSGISQYGLGAERLSQRGTAAHNTVCINNIDSSQMWSGFRVAKRARIIDRMIGNIVDGFASFKAAHTGYKVQGINCIHQRQWHVGLNTIEVNDKITGSFEKAIGYLHLHPDVKVVDVANTSVVLAINGFEVIIAITGADVTVEDTSWHPEFGIAINNKKLCFLFNGNAMSITIQWSEI